MRVLKKYTVFLLSLVFIAVLCTVMCWVSMQKTNHHFSYPLDDTFIHLAMAKNIAMQGCWGINSNAYSATSSSPVFTALLALLIFFSSNHLVLPLLLSSAGTLLLLWLLAKELYQHSSLPTSYQLLVVICTCVLGTTATLTLLGMEHTIQAALVFLFVYGVASILTGLNNRKNVLFFTVLAASLMTLTRYESLFFIAGGVGLLCLQKKIKIAVLVLAAGVLPVVFFGLYSISKGGFFFPNSIMIKSNQSFQYLLNGGTSFIENTRTFSGLVVLALMICFEKYRRQLFDTDFWVLALFLLAAIAHASFISLSWFYRYEAYLITLGSFVILKILLEWLYVYQWRGLRAHWLPVSVTILLLFNLPVRGLNALKNTIRANVNIYQQQMQMGSFLAAYYPYQTIAANDIGAISYYAPITTIDLWGLGNNEVMQARKQKTWNSTYLTQLVAAKKCRLAIVYDTWFDSTLTHAWHKVATWQIPDNFSCGSNTVSFYGITPAEAKLLKANLQAFQKELPIAVSVQYF
jgi:hypothetical protein